MQQAHHVQIERFNALIPILLIEAIDGIDQNWSSAAYIDSDFELKVLGPGGYIRLLFTDKYLQDHTKNGSLYDCRFLLFRL